LDERTRPGEDGEAKKKKRKTVVEGFTITAAGTFFLTPKKLF
jgi:hypothetical protein